MAAQGLEQLAGMRLLLVASTGGHLSQIVRWKERLQLASNSVVVTFDSPQSRSLLQGHPHLFVPYVSPRDYGGVARLARNLARLEELKSSEGVLSTGAGVALSCLPGALMRRKRFVYIESVSRFLGPSTSGRVMQYVPWVERYTQHKSWASSRWRYAGSLLDEYSPMPSRTQGLVHGGRRIFVTLGTIRPYRFDALVERLVNLSRPGDQFTWQLGATTREVLPGDVRAEVSSEEFDAFASSADVVVAHSGVGTLLRMLELGISPVVVARRQHRGEHVDDHQIQVAQALADRGLVAKAEVDELHRELLDSPRPVIQRHQH